MVHVSCQAPITAHVCLERINVRVKEFFCRYSPMKLQIQSFKCIERHGRRHVTSRICISARDARATRYPGCQVARRSSPAPCRICKKIGILRPSAGGQLLNVALSESGICISESRTAPQQKRRCTKCRTSHRCTRNTISVYEEDTSVHIYIYISMCVIYTYMYVFIPCSSGWRSGRRAIAASSSGSRPWLPQWAMESTVR